MIASTLSRFPTHCATLLRATRSSGRDGDVTWQSSRGSSPSWCTKTSTARLRPPPRHGTPPTYSARPRTLSTQQWGGTRAPLTERRFAEKREGHCAHMMTSVTPAAICESWKSIIGLRRNDNRPETTQRHGGASEGSPRQPAGAGLAERTGARSHLCTAWRRSSHT